MITFIILFAFLLVASVVFLTIVMYNESEKEQLKFKHDQDKHRRNKNV